MSSGGTHKRWVRQKFEPISLFNLTFCLFINFQKLAREVKNRPTLLHCARVPRSISLEELELPSKQNSFLIDPPYCTVPVFRELLDFKDLELPSKQTVFLIDPPYCTVPVFRERLDFKDLELPSKQTVFLINRPTLLHCACILRTTRL